jgi:hypothetical protein
MTPPVQDEAACHHFAGVPSPWCAQPLFKWSAERQLLASRQLLEAVDYLHSRWVMSRDLKLPNLLLTADGHLKICDFGLARSFHAYEEPYTPRVVTLWYRCA